MRREIPYGDFCRCDECMEVEPDEPQATGSSAAERAALTRDDEGSIPSPSTPPNELEDSMSDPETEYEFRRTTKRR